MTTSTTEAEFHRRMLRVYDDARDRAGYRASRYLQMVRRRGGVDSAHYLLGTKGLSQGFVALATAGYKSLTVESLVLEEPYSRLFTAGELRVARERLAWRPSGLEPST